MANKFIVGLVGGVAAGAFMLLAPAATWAAGDKKPEDTTRTIQRMEAHWQTLIQERDPAKRKALIASHRQMMAEARAMSGDKPGTPMGDHGQGGMMNQHHQHDLQNTTELHSMMLDMMQ